MGTLTFSIFNNRIFRIGFLILFFLIFIVKINAQMPTYHLETKNDTLLDSHTYSFEVWIKCTNGTLNLKGFEGGWYISNLTALKNNGTLSVSILPGTSQLIALQRPNVVLFKPTAANPHYIQLNPMQLLTSGTIIDSNSVRICTIVLSNTVDFGQVNAGLIYSPNSLYPTVILANYTNPYPTNGDVTTTDQNLLEITDPVFNSHITKYNLTGGSYCTYDTTTYAILSGSQPGVMYRLKANNVYYGTELAATGSTLLWTNLPISVNNYTAFARVKATYIRDSIMNGIVYPSLDTTAPGAASTIIGDTIVCQGQNNVLYHTPLITNAHNYIWHYTGTGATFNVSNDSVKINFSNNATSGYLYVNGTNACSTGAPSVYLHINVNNLPNAAGIITGLDSLCNLPTSTFIYSTTSIINATSYTWDVPYGFISNTINDTTILVYLINSAVPGNISIKGHNACGYGVATVKPLILKYLPSAPDTIIGTRTVCLGQSGVVYTTPLVNNASTYSWSIPANATGTNTGNTINVNFGSVMNTGIISVKGVNYCGMGDSIAVTITAYPLPGSSVTLTGPDTLCTNTNATYTTPIVTQALYYSWTLPYGVTGTITTNSINIFVSDSAQTGLIKVSGANPCGLGAAAIKVMNIYGVPKPASPIQGVDTIFFAQNNVVFKVDSIKNATKYIWTLPNGVLGHSDSNSIVLKFDTVLVSGNITVKGHSYCGASHYVNTCVI